jgi:FkbM family methyltransferase
MSPDRPEPSIARWRANPARQALARIAYPVFLLLNRPAMDWFGRAAYDFALRCNGVAINFKGEYGLTAGEAALLRRRGKSFGDGVVLDVGANTGSYALALTRFAPDARIFSFEPHPRTFALLRARLAGTGVQALNLALADKAGQLDLHDFADADGSTQASLSHDAVTLYGTRTVAHRVEVATLDGFLSDRGIERVAFLKIDTEGFDLNVLRGASAALAERRIGMVQFEFIAANIATRVRMRDFFEVLDGYAIHRLCLNGDLLPLETYSPKRCEIYVNHNLIALPRA